MGYESLHIIELLRLQCLEVDNVYCHLQCTVVSVGASLKDLLGGTSF